MGSPFTVPRRSTEHQYGAPSSSSPSSTADDPFQPATPLPSRPTPSSSNHDPISHRQLPITRPSTLHPSRAVQHRPTADLPASDASFRSTQHPTAPALRRPPPLPAVRRRLEHEATTHLHLVDRFTKLALPRTTATSDCSTQPSCTA
ncbi:hypothetical protein ACLOJK_041027 [Asimina triloba]